MNRAVAHSLAVYVGVVAAATAFFLLLPQADLWFSGLFYWPPRGFALREWMPVVLVFRLVPWLAWGVFLVVTTAAGWLFLMRRPLWRLDRKALVFIAVSTLLGPGLVANSLLKDHWGRARPSQIEAFGGERHFTPAPLPATQCARNCSFVSGHAALGFSLIAFAFLVSPGPARRRIVAAVMTVGALIGLARIAQGAHFLSDVVWAGVLIFATTALCHWVFVERDVLAAPFAVRCYRVLGRETAVAAARLSSSVAWRLLAAMAATILLVVLSIAFVDRPAALFFHQTSPEMQGLFGLITSAGEAWGWLVLSALAFTVLHWGGAFPGLRPWAAKMRAWSAIPAFLFTAVAAAGLAADVAKIGLGRMRPKLLFDRGLYGFSGFSWDPRDWSFPSGHTATFVALVAALWWLWPRHLLFYIFIAAIVAASRIVVGAHYPSDVIAGAFVALVATRAIVWLFARWGIEIGAGPRTAAAVNEVPPSPCRVLRVLVARLRARSAGRRDGRLPLRRGL